MKEKRPDTKQVAFLFLRLSGKNNLFFQINFLTCSSNSFIYENNNSYRV